MNKRVIRMQTVTTNNGERTSVAGDYCHNGPRASSLHKYIHLYLP